MSNVISLARHLTAANPAVHGFDGQRLFSMPLHEIRATVLGQPLTPGGLQLLRRLAHLFLELSVDALRHPDKPKPFRLPHDVALQRIADLLALADEWEGGQ